MKTGVLGRMALVAWLAAAGARGLAAGGKSLEPWERAVVSVQTHRKQYDFFQPWTERVQTLVKSGVVVGPREILTTAENLADRTLVRLQKNGRGDWSDATVTWADYPANLALVTCSKDDFWDGLKPVPLAESIDKDAAIQIVRWRGGVLEARHAEFNRFTVDHPSLSDAVHVQLELTSEIDGVGWGEAAVADRKVIGLVFSQNGNQLRVLPSPFIRSILEARKKDRYHGLGYFDFTWEPGGNPDTLDYLKLSGEKRGAVVIEVPKKPDSPPVLRPHDILLEVDGFDIDTQGDYVDPDYGNLILENLSTRNKWAGDPVRLKIWRDGRQQEVIYHLPKAENAARLVPEAPFDEAPEYLIVGGLVFQPLTKNYLRSWGQDWERRAPFRLAYFRNEDPEPDRPAVVLLSQVLPDVYNLGYQDARQLVLVKVNGRRISYLSDLEAALDKPTNGYHILEFMKGDTLQRMVLDASTLKAATSRVLARFGIDSDRHWAASTK
jgi:PDZ domain